MLRLSSVGDVVNTEPVVATLRESLPSVEIGYAVKAGLRDLVSAHPAIDRVHLLEDGSGALAALARDISVVRYSAVVDLHRNFRSVRIAREARSAIRTCYRKRELSDTIRVRLLRRPFRASKLLVRRYLDALAPIGIDAAVRRPRLFIGESDASAGAALLERAGVEPGRFAAVAPGSVWATKRWPGDRFARLAAGLSSDLGLGVVLLGSRSERALCEEVARLAGGGVINLAGGTSLGETAAVISNARLYVGNDSGPTHMATALGVPTTALFGPTDPGQFDLSGHALVYRNLACSACSFYGGNRCPLGHWKCMLDIEPDEVLAAAKGLFDRARADSRNGSGRPSGGTVGA